MRKNLLIVQAHRSGNAGVTGETLCEAEVGSSSVYSAPECGLKPPAEMRGGA